MIAGDEVCIVGDDKGGGAGDVVTGDEGCLGPIL